LALSGLTSGKNYDVFVYNNSGTMTLELSAAWSSDTARNDAIARQDGVWVKSSDHSRLYIGTIRTTSTTTTEDSLAKRFVWNAYNRVTRAMSVVEATDSWVYNTGTIRQANNNAANQLDFVVGLDGVWVEATVNGIGNVALNAQTQEVLIGLDSTTTNAGTTGTIQIAGGALSMTANYRGTMTVGRHFLAWLERGHGSGTQTFYGDAGVAYHQTGIVGSLLC